MQVSYAVRAGDGRAAAAARHTASMRPKPLAAARKGAPRDSSTGKPLTQPQRVVQMFEQMVEDKNKQDHPREGQGREEAEEAGLSRAAGAAEEGQGRARAAATSSTGAGAATEANRGPAARAAADGFTLLYAEPRAGVAAGAAGRLRGAAQIDIDGHVGREA